MNKNPFRKRYEFWLNLNAETEYEIAEIADELKAQRGYASAIRDGLRMVWELRQGRVDTLVKLFPWIVERFQPQANANELTALVEQVKSMMVNSHSVVVTQAPAWTMPLDNKPEVRVIENEEERKKLSVKNTLAALADF